MSDEPRFAARAAPPFRVLLVDDEPMIRALLNRALARSGFDVVEAASGDAALELFGAEAFDLVISDVQMPSMSGLELMDQLRRRTPDVPVVLISGAFELAADQSPADIGAFAVLSKPFPVEELQGIARRAVGEP